jgi:hypothetical protein
VKAKASSLIFKGINMKNINGCLILNKQDIKNLVFALNTLEQDIGTRGVKNLDLKAKKSFLTVKQIACRLGVDYDWYF